MQRIFLIFFLIFGTLSINAQLFTSKPTWKQEFRSFRKRPLEKWDIYKGAFTYEDQYYTDSIGNVFIKNGFLHILATPDKRFGKKCSSARVSTLGYQSFLYGKLEIKAKIQTGKGIFPAIWMLSEDYDTEDYYPFGEIDIMEYIECFEGKQYRITNHLYDKPKDSKSIHYKHPEDVAADMNDFHIYGLEWTPTCLRFMLDRNEVFRLEKKDAEFWPFDEPYILILNVAYGSWGAQCGLDDTIFPREMLIDWVRYYPLKQPLGGK